jgi:hypothetical protein
MLLKKLYFPLLLALCSNLFSQQWSLKLSSNVELRNWVLTNKADKREKALDGANIALMKGATVIASTKTDLNGDFVIDIPANGDFILTVSYEGCNTKRFYVTTQGVPEAVGQDKYKPTIAIGGFVLSKPISGIDYIGLNEPLVKVEYKAGGQNFDKDESVTNNGLNIISKISESENSVIDKFCSTNKLGDDALAKKKCELARDYYTKAMKIIPGEKYPEERIKLAETCVEQMNARKEEEAAAKAEAQKIAIDKAAKDKAEKDNAAFKKTQAANTKTTAVAAAKTLTVATKTKAATPTATVAESNTPDKPVTQGDITTSSGKYKMPSVLGVNKYKENIQKGDNYFKTKRYKEAKGSYAEAVKCKADDPYAIKKIEECDKLIALPPTK